MTRRPSRDDTLTDQEQIRHAAVTARNAVDPKMRCRECGDPLTADQLGRGAEYCSVAHRKQGSRDRRGATS